MRHSERLFMQTVTGIYHRHRWNVCKKYNIFMAEAMADIQCRKPPSEHDVKILLHTFDCMVHPERMLPETVDCQIFSENHVG